MSKVLTGKDVKLTLNGQPIAMGSGTWTMPEPISKQHMRLFGLLSKLGIRSASTIVDRRPMIFMMNAMSVGKSVVIKNVT